MEENRKHKRCTVHWRSAIRVEASGGAETIQCKTNDVSVDGASVICHRNFFPGNVLTVYLLIDPGSPTHPQVVFEAQGKVMNSVLSGKQGGFRIGIQFTRFAGDSQQLLKKHLPKDAVKPEKLTMGAGAAPPPAAAPGTVAEPAESPAEGTAPPAEAAAAGDAAAPSSDTAATSDAPPQGDAPGQS